MEKLAEEVHHIYCEQYEKDHGKPYWTNGDYTLLDERMKEYDRNIVRWYLSRVPADKEEKCPYGTHFDERCQCKGVDIVETINPPADNKDEGKCDSIVQKFWKMLEDNQFVESVNSITYRVEQYPPAIVDMEAVVKISGEFDKYAIDDFLAQEIAQAEKRGKEKERQRVKQLIDEKSEKRVDEPGYWISINELKGFY